MRRFTFEVGEGEAISFGWAVSFRDFDRNVKVCHPIPLHLLRRWLRDARFWLMRVGRPGYRERVEHAAYLAGRGDWQNREHTAFVRCNQEFVDMLKKSWSAPVHVQIEERGNNELFFVARTAERCNACEAVREAN